MVRRRISTRERAKIFLKEGGVCHLCCCPIIGKAWEVSHEIPLAIGGADDETNWRVAHYKCHKKQTAEVDAPRIAKGRRVYHKHIGAKVSRSPMPFGKKSKFKRKMDGTVVER